MTERGAAQSSAACLSGLQELQTSAGSRSGAPGRAARLLQQDEDAARHRSATAEREWVSGGARRLAITTQLQWACSNAATPRDELQRRAAGREALLREQVEERRHRDVVAASAGRASDAAALAGGSAEIA